MAIRTIDVDDDCKESCKGFAKLEVSNASDDLINCNSECKVSVSCRIVELKRGWRFDEIKLFVHQTNPELCVIWLWRATIIAKGRWIDGWCTNFDERLVWLWMRQYKEWMNNNVSTRMLLMAASVVDFQFSDLTAMAWIDSSLFAVNVWRN